MESLKCLFCQFPWDIFLFALLLGLLLWWLLSNLIARRYKSHNSELMDRINFLEGELEACRKSKVSGSANVDASGQISELNNKINSLQVELDDCKKTNMSFSGAGVTSAASLVSAISEEKPQKDDLKVVEGIGPKIEELCNQAGIYSFAQLASTSAARLKEILDAGGSRFQMHDPTTWPDQSALARDGKWDELKKWQDELNAGKI